MTLHEASSGSITNVNLPPNLKIGKEELNVNPLDYWQQFNDLTCTHPYFISTAAVVHMESVIEAIEFVFSLPEFQQMVLNTSPEIATFDSRVRGVFYGYDFHLSSYFPKLIEINSNAGGALISAHQANYTKNTARNFYRYSSEDFLNESIAKHEFSFIRMFLDEWNLFNSGRPLENIAIVDIDPEQQFLKREFILFSNLFRKFGIGAYIVDPRELSYNGSEVLFRSIRIDLIYNRMTDFYFDDVLCRRLREAYLNLHVCITPNPRSHAIYANKSNLIYLSNRETLEKLAVPQKHVIALANSIPNTVEVTQENADELWKSRKQFFFKPTTGYGSKAAYKGEKLTKSTWLNILNSGSYIAQELVLPGDRLISHKNQLIRMKADLRNYVYNGKIQLNSARLYQGQTTNFRTPGGGFSTVIPVVADISQKLNLIPETVIFEKNSIFSRNITIGIH